MSPLAAACRLSTLIVVVALIVLIIDVTVDGWAGLSGAFLSNGPSRFPDRAGIRPAVVGTLWLVGVAAMLAVPVGLGSAIYLEEYAPRSRWTRLIEANLSNLAGVPSIVFGILGLALFTRTLGLGRSVLAGGLTLGILILPIVVIASQEAIRAVPDRLRQAAFGLGATRWQVIRHQVLPAALPGIVTGSILAVSRAIGETAPLLVLGAVSFIAFSPQSLLDPYTALPVQIYSWISRPQDEFRALAAGAIIVLLVLLLAMNFFAMAIRARFARDR